MSRKHSTSEYLVGCIIALPFIIGFSALFGWLFMLLWNYALVGVFPTVPVLDFYRAWALTLLLSIVGNFFKSSK